MRSCAVIFELCITETICLFEHLCDFDTLFYVSAEFYEFFTGNSAFGETFGIGFYGVTKRYREFLPAFFLDGFYIFLLRQFFSTLPRDYDEAAILDGASYFTIYSRIIMPLCKPALMTVCVFTFMNTWNDFIGPMIYLKDPKMSTVSLGLQMFISQYTTEWHLMMAAATVAIVPMIIMFFFAQRYFIEGMTFAGIKG